MSHDDFPIDTSSPDAEPQAEQSFEDYVHERFVLPMEQLREQITNTTDTNSTDFLDLQKELSDLNGLWYDLGGPTMARKQEVFSIKTEGTPEYENAQAELLEAQLEFDKNLTAYDAEVAEAAEAAEAEQVAEEPEPTPEPISKPQPKDPTPAESPTPVAQEPAEPSPWSNPPVHEQPTDDANTPEKTNESSIKAGDVIQYYPKGPDGKRQKNKSDGWKVVKILDPIEKNPNYMAVVTKDGVREMIPLQRLEKMQSNGKNNTTPKANKTPDTPQGYPDTRPKSNTAQPAVDTSPKEPTPASTPTPGPKPTSTQPKSGEKTTAPSPTQNTGERPSINNATSLKEILEITANEISPEREALMDQWYAEIRNNTELSTLAKEHRISLGPEDYIHVKKLEERLPAMKDLLDDETFQWMSGIINDTSMSPTKKRYEIMIGPNGPSYDALDINEIQAKLRTEGFDYSRIASGPSIPDIPSSAEQTPSNLTPEMQLALASAQEAMNSSNDPSPEQSALLNDAQNSIDPSDSGESNNASLSDEENKQLDEISQLMGLPPAEPQERHKPKPAKAIRNAIGGAINSPRDVSRNAAWWLTSFAKEKPEEEKKFTNSAKKIGKKTFSIFSFNGGEKEKSVEQIQKDGKKATEKLSRQRQRNANRRRWL